MNSTNQCDKKYLKLQEYSLDDKLDRSAYKNCVYNNQWNISKSYWVALIVVCLLAAVTVFSYISTESLPITSVPYEQIMQKHITNTDLLAANDVPLVLHTDPGKVVSCYYNTPNEHDANQLMPSDIHPQLCTHINVAFARVVNKEISLTPFQYKFLPYLVKLKQSNPKLKILVSVGGSHNDNGFSDMVLNHASRKVFIKSIKYMLRNYTLDGIDLDWEFPGLHNNGHATERQHFSQLLREIRAEYNREKRDYLLTVAVPAPDTIVSISYDVDQLNTYTDFVNVMTYDFHYFTKFTPFTGLNSPLYARDNEQLYLATLNINYTVHMYLNKGLDRNKIVVGIPTFGHTFKLVNPENSQVGSPASGYGSLGALGFINYPDICIYLKKFKDEVSINEDHAAKVPYLYRKHDWVSYDTTASVIEKAKFIKDHNLRGAMIYSLNADDFQGLCGNTQGSRVRFPLSQSIKNTLIFNNMTMSADVKEPSR